MSSPTQRSNALLKKEGWVSAVVEKWNAFAKPFGKRIDLFGIIDCLAIKGDITLGVQNCSGGPSSHITKALAEPRLWDWLEGRDRQFEIWCWRKIGKKGKRKTYQVRRIGFKLQKDKTVIYEEQP